MMNIDEVLERLKVHIWDGPAQLEAVRLLELAKKQSIDCSCPCCYGLRKALGLAE